MGCMVKDTTTLPWWWLGWRLLVEHWSSRVGGRKWRDIFRAAGEVGKKGRSAGRHAKLAREESRQACLMFPLTSRLLICFPLLIFSIGFYYPCQFQIEVIEALLWLALFHIDCFSFWICWCLFVFIFYHNKPIKWSCSMAHSDTHFLYVCSIFLFSSKLTSHLHAYHLPIICSPRWCQRRWHYGDEVERWEINTHDRLRLSLFWLNLRDMQRWCQIIPLWNRCEALAIDGRLRRKSRRFITKQHDFQCKQERKRERTK